MHTARVSLLFVCRCKKVESYVQVSLHGLMEEEELVIVVIHCKTKATQQASQAKQSKAIGLRDQGNMLIAKRKQQKLIN
jgi:hypothetical protein